MFSASIFLHIQWSLRDMSVVNVCPNAASSSLQSEIPRWCQRHRPRARSEDVIDSQPAAASHRQNTNAKTVAERKKLQLTSGANSKDTTSNLTNSLTSVSEPRWPTMLVYDLDVEDV